MRELPPIPPRASALQHHHIMAATRPGPPQESPGNIWPRVRQNAHTHTNPSHTMALQTAVRIGRWWHWIEGSSAVPPRRHDVVATSWCFPPEMWHLPVLLHWESRRPRDRQLVNCPPARALGSSREPSGRAGRLHPQRRSGGQARAGLTAYSFCRMRPLHEYRSARVFPDLHTSGVSLS